MAASGWYPDPSGQPGRFRYWDGHQWSAETTDDPSRPFAPGSGASDGRERHRLVLVAVVAVALVAVLIATIAVLVHRQAIRADDNPPVSTASGWNDSSPNTDESGSGSPSGSAGPTDSPSGSASSASMPSPTGDPRPDGAGLAPPTTRPKDVPRSECPAERIDSWSKQPDPHRIQGGDLSMPRLGSPWHAVIDDQYSASWGFARDIGGLAETIDYGDSAIFTVGAVRTMAKHRNETVKQSAIRLSHCVVQDYLDQGLVVTGVRHLQSESITVDGHQGWLVRTQSAIDDLQHGSDGLLADIVVVDTGKRLSFFYGEIPYPDARRIGTMDAMVEALRVS